MRITLKNEYGSFEMGGGSHDNARINDVAGIGIPDKSADKVTFVGQPGSTIQSIRDTERTITISLEFYGDPHTVQKLYRVIYAPVDMYFSLGHYRRRISGRIITATEIRKIIYHRWQSIVLQFLCSDPYFHDYNNTILPLMTATDHFPNLLDEGVWYISLPAVATTSSSEAVIINRGDTVLYPILHITNVSDIALLSAEHGLIIRNTTTGKQIEIDNEVTAGDEIIVDLPHRKVTSRLNGNITNNISDDTVLGDFYLQTGENAISVESLNIADILSVTIEYNNNYAAVVI